MACAPAEEIRRAGASRSGTSAGAGVGVAGPTCARVAGGAAFGAARTGSDGDVGNRRSWFEVTLAVGAPGSEVY